MRGQIGIVESSERAEDEGAHVVEVQCDPGGGAAVTAEHYAPPGVDARPLPGDTVALQPSTGSGRMQAAGYADTRNEGKAEAGEHRVYARDANGEVVAEVWVKGNGDVAIRSIKAGGKVTINGVEIDQDGNIATPGAVAASGEITAMATGPGVKLSTHLHPTAIGPTSPPTPGT